ncbi:MAG: guanylate kinase [Chthoniobacterales bacterium]|nr:guanylate kinase [Chthoniobacterales bacterium]
MWSRPKRSSSESANRFKTLSNQFGRSGILFVVSAPSGAGKTTLCDALRQTPDFVYSVSCTTRPPRSNEIEGEDYYFVSEQDFLARVAAGELLEHAQVHEHRYGTLRTPVVTNLRRGVDVLIDVDTQGAAAIRAFADEFTREALCDVFIMPPDLDELRRRLIKRGTETGEQIELRLVNAAREMQLWRDYRYTIISKSMEEDLQKFRHIMGAERYLSRRLVQNYDVP